jgi:hypothetical protein
MRLCIFCKEADISHKLKKATCCDSDKCKAQRARVYFKKNAENGTAAKKPKKPKQTKICTLCNSEYLAFRENQNTCSSLKCRRETRKLYAREHQGKPTLPMINCSICNDIFQPKRITEKICSPKCRDINTILYARRYRGNLKKTIKLTQQEKKVCIIIKKDKKEETIRSDLSIKPEHKKMQEVFLLKKRNKMMRKRLRKIKKSIKKYKIISKKYLGKK